MSSDAPLQDQEPDLKVQLKPLFGVEPKYYLAVLYGLVVLAALAALVVGPGLWNPGTLVKVTSVPPGAAVVYAGKHYGTTPLQAYFPAGKGSLEVSRPGFQPQVKDYVSGNNLFLSQVFPRTDEVVLTLVPTGPDSVTDRLRSEVGRWALAVPFTANYQFPPLFTRFAADARAAGLDDQAVKAFLLSLRPAVADAQMYADYGRALGLWKADAQAPEGLDAQFALWEPLVGAADGRLALWLLANQTTQGRMRETAEPSDWFKAQTAAFQASLGTKESFGTAPGSLRSAAGTFRGVPGAQFRLAQVGKTFDLPVELPYTLPVPAETAPFWIADAEVTQAEFDAFVTANPKWAPGAKAALMEAGLADQDYLSLWKDGKPSSPAQAAAEVSWYAAEAYCSWLNASGRVPAGKKAGLPTEYQWEAAARSPGGASMLNQGVWEWTSSAWYPGRTLVETGAAAAEAQAYARTLKGGAQGPKGGLTAGDRAGWPAAGATRGLGFRVALVGAP